MGFCRSGDMILFIQRSDGRRRACTALTPFGSGPFAGYFLVHAITDAHGYGDFLTCLFLLQERDRLRLSVISWDVGLCADCTCSWAGGHRQRRKIVALVVNWPLMARVTTEPFLCVWALTSLCRAHRVWIDRVSRYLALVTCVLFDILILL